MKPQEENVYGQSQQAGPPTIMEQIEKRVHADSHQVSHHILDGCILEDVAKHIWQEEVVSKF